MEGSLVIAVGTYIMYYINTMNLKYFFRV